MKIHSRMLPVHCESADTTNSIHSTAVNSHPQRPLRNPGTFLLQHYFSSENRIPSTSLLRAHLRAAYLLPSDPPAHLPTEPSPGSRTPPSRRAQCRRALTPTPLSACPDSRTNS